MDERIGAGVAFALALGAFIFGCATGESWESNRQTYDERTLEACISDIAYGGYNYNELLSAPENCLYNAKADKDAQEAADAADGRSDRGY